MMTFFKSMCYHLKISTREILAQGLGGSRHKYNSEGEKKGGQRKKGCILKQHINHLPGLRDQTL